MLLLGLLLVGATAAFTFLLVAYNSSGGPAYEVMMFGHHLATVSGPRIFLAGIALSLVFALGCAMLLAGGARARSQRVELRATRAEARRTAAERDALAERLGGTDPTPAPAAPAAPVAPVAPVVMRKSRIRTGAATTDTAVDPGDGGAAPGEAVAEPVSGKRPLGLRGRFGL